jgi:Protein of unknown function (DUF2846)
MFRTLGKLKPLLLCAVLLTLQACASGPLFNDVAATRQGPAPGLGRIYVYRTTTTGAAIQPSVMLNDQKIGEAVPLGFFFADRPAGDYIVSATTEVERTQSLTLEAGQTDYVRLDISIGFFAGHISPTLVEPEVGAKEIATLHYTGAPLPAQAAAAPLDASPVPLVPRATPAAERRPTESMKLEAQSPPPAAAAPPPPELAPVAVALAPASPPPVAPPPQPAPVAAPPAPPRPVAAPPAQATLVPQLSPRQQAKFAEFLTKPLPRVFVISPNGHFASVWGSLVDAQGRPVDLRQKALDGCREAAGQECQLYAIDDTVLARGTDLLIE